VTVLGEGAMAVDPVDVDVHTWETTAMTDAEAIYRFRLTVLEHAATTGNVAATCEMFKVSRKSFFKLVSVTYRRSLSHAKLRAAGHQHANPERDRVERQRREAQPARSWRRRRSAGRQVGSTGGIPQDEDLEDEARQLPGPRTTCGDRGLVLVRGRARDTVVRRTV
jgi:hypothetical protein